ncbi:hypothetical protein [Aeromicrobium sp. A1-2]|uniref:hypothetical protein n=1 Tax=Aeromicrobium sp. A1-2 TaxID=2107713 RepID=UPI0013C2A69E|nr:hypothetical protein [Aeromicrobium sp. A1-2]
MLTRAYVDIGYDLDPSTIGSIEDYRSGVTSEAVQTALIEAYGAGAVRAPLSQSILQSLSTGSP